MYVNVNRNEYRIHIGMLIAKDAKCAPFRFGTNDKIKPNMKITNNDKLTKFDGRDWTKGILSVLKT